MQSFGATDVDRQLLGSSVEADVHEEREQEEKHAALNTIHTSNSNLSLHMAERFYHLVVRQSGQVSGVLEQVGEDALVLLAVDLPSLQLEL